MTVLCVRTCSGLEETSLSGSTKPDGSNGTLDKWCDASCRYQLFVAEMRSILGKGLGHVAVMKRHGVMVEGIARHVAVTNRNVMEFRSHHVLYEK